MHQTHYKKPLFSGKGKTSSVSGLNNYWEAKITKFILPALWGLQLRHHKILTESEQYYPFVPHSHAILYLSAF